MFLQQEVCEIRLRHVMAEGVALPVLFGQGVTRCLSLGNNTVSRTFLAPVSAINRRATPSPQPACGGAP